MVPGLPLKQICTGACVGGGVAVGVAAGKGVAVGVGVGVARGARGDPADPLDAGGRVGRGVGTPWPGVECAEGRVGVVTPG